MKQIVLLMAVLLSSLLVAAAGEKPAKADRLLHVVSFKFKPSASQAQIDQVVAAFRDLKKKIPVIRQLEWGTNVSPEKHDKGFTHGFLLAFRNEKDRDAYLVHPEHQAFGKIVGPLLDDVFVIDYWAQK